MVPEAAPEMSSSPFPMKKVFKNGQVYMLQVESGSIEVRSNLSSAFTLGIL